MGWRPSCGRTVRGRVRELPSSSRICAIGGAFVACYDCEEGAGLPIHAWHMVGMKA